MDMLSDEATSFELGKEAYALAAANEWESLKLLIDANPCDDLANAYEHPSAWGQTALLQACCHGHLESVQVLLDAGANVLVRSRGPTPTYPPAGLARHFKRGQWESCIAAVNEHIITIAADGEPTEDWLGEVVYAAADTNEHELLRILLDLHAGVDLANSHHCPRMWGYTPLLAAAYWGHLESVQQLVDAGADLRVKSRGPEQGYQPADYTRRFKNGKWEECVAAIEAGPRALLSLQVSIIKGDSDKCTLVCTTLSGSEVLELPVDRQLSAHEVSAQIAKHLRRLPSLLRLVLPNGRILEPEKDVAIGHLLS
eukprot:TRINITY_DN60581_c0_g1_i1.p1 TRINITY_DN60581_c0_g1~~TRINITY_DN60581_c0_g1_i1.p1  ORF type:complete len:312 (+),score=49.26 TRINITY_DN60581_c0_g1_i1:79-1014(+)